MDNYLKQNDLKFTQVLNEIKRENSINGKKRVRASRDMSTESYRRKLRHNLGCGRVSTSEDVRIETMPDTPHEKLTSSKPTPGKLYFDNTFKVLNGILNNVNFLPGS